MVRDERREVVRMAMLVVVVGGWEVWEVRKVIHGMVGILCRYLNM